MIRLVYDQPQPEAMDANKCGPYAMNTKASMRLVGRQFPRLLSVSKTERTLTWRIIHGNRINISNKGARHRTTHQTTTSTRRAPAHSAGHALPDRRPDPTEVVLMAKRHKGKRHKNRRADGTFAGGRGFSPRNKTWGECTHLNYATGKKCGERVRIKRGRRPLCEKHRRRHSSMAKTKAIIHQCESVKEGR